MFFMEYMVLLVMILVVFSVVVLGFVVVPHHGVIALMGSSLLCCVVMVLMGRTYTALVMYIVYLGGLIVIFGYCVSVEKGGDAIKGVGGLWYLVMMFGAVTVVGILALILGGIWGMGGYSSCEGWVSLEVNGCGVFYLLGGVGLVVCAWGLIVALFSVLVILGWGCKGGVRSF